MPRGGSLHSSDSKAGLVVGLGDVLVIRDRKTRRMAIGSVSRRPGDDYLSIAVPMSLIDTTGHFYHVHQPNPVFRTCRGIWVG